MSQYLSVPKCKDLVAEKMGVSESLIPRKSTIIVNFGDISDLDDLLNFLCLVHGSDGDIVHFVFLSKAYAIPATRLPRVFEKDIAYINSEKTVDGKELSLQQKCNLFNRMNQASENGDYDYVSQHDAVDVLKRYVYTLHTLFHTYNKVAGRKFSIVFRDAEGNLLFNTRNPFGFIWASELSNLMGPLDSCKVSEEEINAIYRKYDDAKQTLVIPNAKILIIHVAGPAQAFLHREFVESLTRNSDGTPREAVHLVVMGGITDHEKVTTLASPALRGRLPIATMNQLYCPEGFEELLKWLAQNPHAGIHVVTNNACSTHANFTVTHPGKEEGKSFTQFLFELLGVQDSEPEGKDKLANELFATFYPEDKHFRRKLFDLLSARVVLNIAHGDTDALKKEGVAQTGTMYFDPRKAATIVKVHGIDPVGDSNLEFSKIEFPEIEFPYSVNVTIPVTPDLASWIA